MRLVTAPFAPEELRRYGRQIILPEIGVAGQRRLRGARVLVVGAGGLGSPAALYLAAAGVGTLGLVEFDVVDESNLHRQILFDTRDVGRSKIEVAAARIGAVNPHVRLELEAGRLDVGNALRLVAAYDLVVDGSDNFPTRYLVNDACVSAGRPLVWGSVFRFEGQVSVFAAPDGPCYRCLFPEPPPPGLVPTCAEAGVFGALPGVIGSLQATQAIQWIAGIGEPLVGRLLLFDALGGRFREVRLPRDPDCPRCAPGRRQAPLVACADTCEIAEGAFELDPVDVARRLEAGEPLALLDVREPFERELAVLPGDLWIPLAELPRRFGELPPDRPLVVYCHVGGRSARAVEFLRRHDRPRAYNLAGGIDAWAAQVDPSLPRY
jgi:adenylyltransferase/sulfurtransferase